MTEKNAVEEAVENYIALQEKEKEIKKLLTYWKKQLMETIEANQGLPIKTDDAICRVVERVTYVYSPEKLIDAIGPDAAKLVITRQVDVQKLKGLIKGGIVSEEVANQAREEVKRVKALVVKKLKEAK
jgi:hypothetical protein